MGDSFDEGYPADGEAPVHTVELEAFRMDTTAVTNEQFAAFVDATGYRTEAEKYGTSAVFHLVVQAQTSDILGAASGSPWWLTVKGADWAHPTGPGLGALTEWYSPQLLAVDCVDEAMAVTAAAFLQQQGDQESLIYETGRSR